MKSIVVKMNELHTEIRNAAERAGVADDIEIYQMESEYSWKVALGGNVYFKASAGKSYFKFFDENDQPEGVMSESLDNAIEYLDMLTSIEDKQTSKERIASSINTIREALLTIQRELVK